MKATFFLAALGLALVLAPTPMPAADKDETAKVLKQYEPKIEQGLKWLADHQEKDGHWEGPNGTLSMRRTALAGLALLAEGSTTKDGKYAEQLRKAVAWVMEHADDDGRFINAKDRTESKDYMTGHGVALLFLSQVYATEADEKKKKEIGKVLEKGLAYAQKAQTDKGGWGFVAAKEGGGLDEGNSTAAVLHGVFACRKAGVPVPKELIASSLDYLKNSTRANAANKDATKVSAGVIYSLAQDRGNDRGRPALTVAALALFLNAGETKNDLTVQWLNFVRDTLTLRPGTGDAEFTYFYLAQAGYQLGEEGHAKLRPDTSKEERLRWSVLRKELFTSVAAGQQKDGSWTFARGADPYNPTATALIILQLDKGNLPYYKR